MNDGKLFSWNASDPGSLGWNQKSGVRRGDSGSPGMSLPSHAPAQTTTWSAWMLMVGVRTVTESGLRSIAVTIVCG